MTENELLNDLKQRYKSLMNAVENKKTDELWLRAKDIQTTAKHLAKKFNRDL